MMMEVVRGNTVRREDNPKVATFRLIKKDIKCTKTGVPKKTINNSKEDRFVDPIREKDDVARIASYLLSRAKAAKTESKMKTGYRNWLIFVVGVNVGVRVSDLTCLKWDHIFEADMKTFRKAAVKIEKKTGKTKLICINRDMARAFKLYLDKTGIKPKPDAYIFQSEYNRGDGEIHTLSTSAVEKVIKTAARECGLKGNYNTHSLRKTYAYHKFMQYQAEGDPLALEKVQADLNHRMNRDTLKYLGITRNEKIESSKRLSNYWGENLFGAIEDETE